jgi:hypothetical protein
MECFNYRSSVDTADRCFGFGDSRFELRGAGIIHRFPEEAFVRKIDPAAQAETSY